MLFNFFNEKKSKIAQMLMHMKLLYTIKKILEYPSKKSLLIYFLTIKYNYYSMLDNKY